MQLRMLPAGSMTNEMKKTDGIALAQALLTFQLHPTEPVSILSRIQKLYSYTWR